MWQAEFKLYLYPDKPKVIIELSKLITLLSELKFINHHLGDNRYATGDKFVSLLTFMGCSPDIELEPQEDSPYCYIEVETASKAVFISGKNIKKAKCPHCKVDLKQPMTCPNCQETLKPETLNWRKTAFFASTWIAIGNIYELEAIPNDHFLDMLENQTGVKWKPAYIRQAST